MVMQPIEADVDSPAAARGPGDPESTGSGRSSRCASAWAASREQTQKEVADRLGISQSYISRLEKAHHPPPPPGAPAACAEGFP